MFIRKLMEFVGLYMFERNDTRQRKIVGTVIHAALSFLFAFPFLVLCLVSANKGNVILAIIGPAGVAAFVIGFVRNTWKVFSA